MISLVFDTETTGPVHKDLSFASPAQPHLVELAFELYDDERCEVMASGSFLVNPGVPIPAKATEVHGITDAMAAKYGINPLVACAVFSNYAKRSGQIVCHNTGFDIMVMTIEFMRLKKPVGDIMAVPNFCTMENSTNILKLPGKFAGKYKWPTLEEAYKHFVDPKGFEGAHRAMNDVQATRRIFVEVQKELKKECKKTESKNKEK